LALSGPGTNLWLPPFVSIMPHFGSHDMVFSATFQERWFSKALNPGEWMGYVRRKPDKVPWVARGVSFVGTMAWGVGAFALASATAAWISGFNPVAWASGDASPKNIVTLSFDDRFSIGSAPASPSAETPPPSLARSLASAFEVFEQPAGRLAQKLPSLNLRATIVEEPKPFVEEPKPQSVAAVPLPRSRPPEANLEPAKNLASAAPTENRSLLDKLSDLFPARAMLASLAPDSGLFAERPNLAALGYDRVTAVYDISARTVYMPDGSILEAHSGLGSLMDDPAHVNEPNVGATPPNVYDLKPRESLFHGVQALRMTPADDSGTFGRTGLLTHSYMLDARGGSNGCVSIKYYDKFLKAFTNGEVKRLVVVPSLKDEKSGLRQST